jgi:signal transduction histidine kinase
VGDRAGISRYRDAVRLSLRSVLLDVLLALVLTGLTLATLIIRTGGRIGWPAYALVVLTAAPLGLRQRVPVLTMATMLGALVAYGLLGFGGDDVPNGGVGVLVGMFTVATLRPRLVAAIMFLAALIAVVVYLTAAAAIAWPLLAQATLVLVGAWVLGEGTRRWGQRVERLAAQAARVVAEERVRIARELHDIVAHHMSVVALQSGLAEYVLDTDLATARKAIGSVGDASREALLEMRRLLDVLRVDHGTDSDYSPQPGLAVLDELVDRARGAGLRVDVVITGPARPLPPGPDLCAYRVVQESLTNVLKHAGPAAARIAVDYGEQTLTVKVTDDGHQPAAHYDSVTSHGIRGMRERAELYGGVLTAGPAETGGFAVIARLPIGAVA